MFFVVFLVVLWFTPFFEYLYLLLFVRRCVVCFCVYCLFFCVLSSCVSIDLWRLLFVFRFVKYVYACVVCVSSHVLFMLSCFRVFSLCCLCVSSLLACVPFVCFSFLVILPLFSRAFVDLRF